MIGPDGNRESDPLLNFKMAELRIVFMGTAELACASLAGLARTPGFQVIGVVSQPDRPRGRDMKLHPTAVKALASELNLPVHQPEKARHESFVQILRELAPDLIVVAAYGQILPRTILDLPKYGCLNVHTSLLPKYRGAAPIQWAIIDGEPETGVTIMKMDVGLDTGDILTQVVTKITAEDNAAILHDRLATLGAELLVQTIPQYVSGSIQPRPQPAEGATYARKIEKEDGKLDWNQSAEVLFNRIRGFTPWPGAFTFLPNEAKRPLLKILKVELATNASGQPGEVLASERGSILIACGNGALRVLELQREGGKRLTAAEFLIGYSLIIGSRFS